MGYTVNQDKSIVLGLNISLGLKQEISKVIKAEWKEEEIKYLGIQVSKFRGNMVKGNTEPLMQYMEGSFKVWTRYKIPWFGRLTEVKNDNPAQTL